MKYLTDATSDIFGTIKPPITSIPSEPTVAFGSLISAAIQIFILVAAFTMMIYLFLGAIQWISSGGEKEKLTKAQQQITNAVVGILVLVVVLSVFCVIKVDVLKIPGASCFSFTLPTISP